MVDDVAINNRVGGIAWRRGGGWVVLTDGYVGMAMAGAGAGAGALVIRKPMGTSLAWHT
jgi:hypothetical protein